MNCLVVSRPPVVLLGAKHHAGLAMARSLGRFGARVFAVEVDRLAPVSFSRYCVRCYRWDLKVAPCESLAFLAKLAHEIGARPILLPTTDQSALFVVDHATQLSHNYVFPAQQATNSHALVCKKSMFDLATAHGIPTPATFAPKSEKDVLDFLKIAQFPVVIKADDGAKPWRPHHPAAKTKCIVRGKRELLEQYERMRNPEEPNVVFQEYIPGGEDTIWMFNGYFNTRSECLFGMTGKKLRQCPAYTGAACLATCIHNEEVYRLTIQFIKAIGYQGILDIGYRYDARDGKFKVLDVNPRIGSTFRLFVRADGLDVARSLYLDLTGQPVPSGTCLAERRKWIVEDCDLISSLRYFRDGNLKPSEWVRSFRGVQECSFLSVHDPAPLLAMLGSDLLELSRRTVNRLWGKSAAPRATRRKVHEPRTASVDPMES